MDEIYLSSSRSTYTFDRKKGLIARIALESTQGYGFKGKGTGTTELEAVESHGAEWAKDFGEASERYFAANKAYERLVAKASREADRVDDLLSQAEAGLKSAREEIREPVLRDRLDEQLQNHKDMGSYYVEEAKNRASVVGHAAADWEAEDLDGTSHALKDYRGKVVILDFWYRGCGWCIRAMPQVKQLADDFKGKPVAVLGMNTDRKLEDARLVVDKMGLTYPSLKAEKLPEKYHVRGFPTLIIIDQEGKVADIHVGYSPNLREEVTKSVEGLLSRK